MEDPNSFAMERDTGMEEYSDLVGQIQGDTANPCFLSVERGKGLESIGPNAQLGDGKEELEEDGRRISEGNEALEDLDPIVGERNGEIESPSSVARGVIENATSLVGGETKREMDTPPIDDCCAICFGNFTIACKTNCGHWFCGTCILQYWNYCTPLQRCKCPICACLISKLTPEASISLQKEEEVVEVLKNVQRYNCLFVGGAHGLKLKMLQLPLIMKRMCQGLTDPDRFRFNYYLFRYLALLLSLLYEIANFDFIPMGRAATRRLFDYSAVALVAILCIVGIFRRRLLGRRVRLLAAH